MTSEDFLIALGIFVLRIVNNAVGTIRLLTIARQMRMLSAVLAFLEALIFAVVMMRVVSNLSNIWDLLAYCGGFAVGSWLGMALEARFVVSYSSVNIITRRKGHEIAEALRLAGYGVTETVGIGREGEVAVLRSVVVNREVPKVLDLIRDTHDEVFVAVEEVRPMHRGWLRSVRAQQ